MKKMRDILVGSEYTILLISIHGWLSIPKYTERVFFSFILEDGRCLFTLRVYLVKSFS